VCITIGSRNPKVEWTYLRSLTSFFMQFVEDVKSLSFSGLKSAIDSKPTQKFAFSKPSLEVFGKCTSGPSEKEARRTL